MATVNKENDENSRGGGIWNYLLIGAVGVLVFIGFTQLDATKKLSETVADKISSTIEELSE
ncbi:MAG: hypothetical protein DI628_02205 [Blastochloris viridis]|uniref:Uncharacterized protein n=1 Tax=Blastochloris viridis TaxID=1079 RepID=A0A6N4REK1_BLAVI|nr:MAG: hypothetical protein DI628_02205 [Blastochloris viridis]